MFSQTAPTLMLTLNNIIWLLAAMAFVIAPHVMRLPIWVTAVCIAAGVWRFWIARKGLRAPHWWLMAIISIAITAGAYFEYRRLFGRDVGVTLLIVMLCLKVLEMKMKRDALVVIFLGFFLALTNFLYSQTIFMGAYMFGCVWIFIATLIGFQRINTEATLRERVVPAGWLMLQALPMMLVLFFLFPRMAGPLWSMPLDNQATSGLSDSMSPGDISKLSKSDAVAFGVDFEAAVPQTQDLYWRGPVLGKQTSRGWVPYLVKERESLNFEKKSSGIKYRVTLQPHNKRWLFALDLPAALPLVQDGATFYDDFQMQARMPVTQLQSYDVVSHVNYRTADKLSDNERRLYLAYNPKLNPRTIAYGKKLATDYPDPKALVDNLFKLYNSEFTYTLEPPLLGENAMDEFLFDTKQGFCEHYSSSFVLLMRAAGIPARVVTGYQGGEVNPISRQLVVRQSDAHAWSEVWFDDLGWLRVDPTSFVSPLRINSGFSAALGPQGMFNSIIDADKLGLLKQIRFSWDAVNNRWNQWVIGFNAARQKGLFEDFGFRDVDWQATGIALVIGVALAGGIVGAFVMLSAYRTRKEPVVATYEKLCAKLSKVGLDRAINEGPMDFFERICLRNEQLGQAAQPVFAAYIELRYLPQGVSQGLSQGPFLSAAPASQPPSEKSNSTHAGIDRSTAQKRQFLQTRRADLYKFKSLVKNFQPKKYLTDFT